MTISRLNLSEKSRYLAVGMANTAVDYSVFLLIVGSTPLALATFLSSAIAMCFAFVAHGRYTFSRSGFHWKQLIKFLGITGTTMWLLQPLLILCFSSLGELLFSGFFLIFIAKGSALAVCLTLNFLGYKFLVWR